MRKDSIGFYSLIGLVLTVLLIIIATGTARSQGPLHKRVDSLQKIVDSLHKRALVIDTTGYKVTGVKAQDVIVRTKKIYEAPPGSKIVNNNWLVFFMACTILLIPVGGICYAAGSYYGAHKNPEEEALHDRPILSQEDDDEDYFNDNYKYEINFYDAKGEIDRLVGNKHSYNTKTKVLTVDDGELTYKMYNVDLISVIEDTNPGIKEEEDKSFS